MMHPSYLDLVHDLSGGGDLVDTAFSRLNKGALGLHVVVLLAGENNLIWSA